MLLDPVLRLRGPMPRRLITGGTPGKEITANLYIIVAEFGVLRVVHTQQLSLFAGTKLQPRYKIDEFGDDGGHDEGVGGGGNDSGNLPANDFVVAVDEAAAGADVDAVEADDFSGGKEGVEDEADDAADAVLGEDIEGVVDADEEFD